MLKLAILTILAVPSIMASTWEQMANTLIAEKDTEKLGQTFQALHKEHGNAASCLALVEVAKQGHPEMVATCLRTEQDPSPNDKRCVSLLVHGTFLFISNSTSDDPESFAKMIAAFKPTDVKPLASIRCRTLDRRDAVNVLKRVMDKSPEPIIGTLPSWLASHTFDQNSPYHNQTALEKSFQYLASFATESVLEKALSIVKANEHHKVDRSNDPIVMCRKSQDVFPQDLVNKLTGLLELMKARNELVKGALSFMPGVLLNLLADYITYEAT
jgi:hypothetical protein